MCLGEVIPPAPPALVSVPEYRMRRFSFTNMPPRLRMHGINPASTAGRGWPCTGPKPGPSCTWDRRARIRTAAEGSWEQSIQSTFLSTRPGEGSGFSTQTQPPGSLLCARVPRGPLRPRCRGNTPSLQVLPLAAWTWQGPFHEEPKDQSPSVLLRVPPTRSCSTNPSS